MISRGHVDAGQCDPAHWYKCRSAKAGVIPIVGPNIHIFHGMVWFPGDGVTDGAVCDSHASGDTMLGCSVAQVMISNSVFTLLIMQRCNAIYCNFDRWLRRALDILESEPQESLELARTCPQMSCRCPYFWLIFLHHFLLNCPVCQRKATKAFDAAAELDNAADASRLVALLSGLVRAKSSKSFLSWTLAKLPVGLGKCHLQLRGRRGRPGFFWESFHRRTLFAVQAAVSLASEQLEAAQRGSDLMQVPLPPGCQEFFNLLFYLAVLQDAFRQTIFATSRLMHTLCGLSWCWPWARRASLRR